MPKLVSDAVAKGSVEKYVVILDGVSSESAPEVVDDATVRLGFDLSGVPSGDHSVQVLAVNAWGESSPVDFSFASEKPADPSGLRIEF